jgi:hypothetical protein
MAIQGHRVVIGARVSSVSTADLSVDTSAAPATATKVSEIKGGTESISQVSFNAWFDEYFAEHGHYPDT